MHKFHNNERTTVTRSISQSKQPKHRNSPPINYTPYDRDSIIFIIMHNGEQVLKVGTIAVSLHSVTSFAAKHVNCHRNCYVIADTIWSSVNNRRFNVVKFVIDRSVDRFRFRRLQMLEFCKFLTGKIRVSRSGNVENSCFFAPKFCLFFEIKICIFCLFYEFV